MIPSESRTPAHARLAALRIAPLCLRLETTGPLRVPEYKGALFRGGFGHFFRDLVCVTGAPKCAGCTYLATCPYSLVFETPVLPESFSVLRKYTNAPHPFVLVPPLDGRSMIPSGTALEASLTLIGRGLAYLPHFIRVFDELGRSGRYGGRFRLRSVVSALDRNVVVYDGALRRVLCEPPLWRPEVESSPVNQMRLDFVTPLRMRTDGMYNLSPDFVAVTHALLRRLHLLTAVHEGAAAEVEWLRPLLASADGVRTQTSEFQVYQWGRMSGTQRRRVQMDGVMGTLTAVGEMTELAPFFRAGEWLNVGSGTSLGMGRYWMRVEG